MKGRYFYDAANDALIPITADTNFVGTRAEWNQLSSDEKAMYKTMDFKRDYRGSTIDDAPTENSLNVVRSGGVYDAIHGETELRTVLGAKNFLGNYNKAASKTDNNTTWTLLSNGMWRAVRTSASGSNGQVTLIAEANGAGLIPEGEYFLTGCPSGGGNDTYYISIGVFSGDGTYAVVVKDTGSGVSVTVPDGTCTVELSLVVRPYVIASPGILFKPMLTLASDDDLEYQPFAMTNKQLTDAIMKLL